MHHKKKISPKNTISYDCNQIILQQYENYSGRHPIFMSCSFFSGCHQPALNTLAGSFTQGVLTGIVATGRINRNRIFRPHQPAALCPPSFLLKICRENSANGFYLKTSLSASQKATALRWLPETAGENLPCYACLPAEKNRTPAP